MTQISGYKIVFGNEKGGSGKSTAAMHAAIALLKLGYSVGSIDLDARQGTLTRYMRNRFHYARESGQMIPIPAHMAVTRSEAKTTGGQEEEDKAFLAMALEELSERNDFIVIDTPGADSYLSRIAHRQADTLVTPVNDSFIDLDMIADIDPENHAILGPSVYTKMVREQSDQKKIYEGKDIDWIVMRNRLISADANNKREISSILERAGDRFDFRLTHGFGERVIFKELFLKGLTLMDIKGVGNTGLTMSEVTARQEVRQLIAAIGPGKAVERRRMLSALSA